jgi:hypothetical protein
MEMIYLFMVYLIRLLVNHKKTLQVAIEFITIIM